MFSYFWLTDLFSLLMSVFFHSANARVTVQIVTSNPIQNVSQNFVSVGLEAGMYSEKRKVKENFKFRSVKMQTLAKALAPCYLRMGGTTADFLTFSDSSELQDLYATQWTHWNNTSYGRYKRDVIQKKDLKNFTMTESMWDETLQFIKIVGWDFIFDLNVLKRRNDRWDPSNAISLFKYTLNKGYRLSGYELGNEPNDFRKLVGYQVTPDQLAEDYKTLRDILNTYFPGSLMIGPSVTQLSHKKSKEYFIEFMKNPAASVVTSPTFHQYYVNGRTATIDEFMNPEILDDLATEIKIGNSILSQYHVNKKLWLGETSSAYGGGAPDLSDRYVAGFMWMDKLGVSAKFSVDVVVRQSFFAGNYALIDYDEIFPFPDYWLTVLYKTLVGRNVLNVSTDDTSRYVRIYSHCTNTQKSNYTAGSVTIYGMNLMNSSVEVVFPQFHDLNLHLYLLEPENEDLTSGNVKLNGKLLQLTKNNTLPDLLIPKIVRSPIVIPAQRFGFIVVPSADVKACV